MSEVKPISPGLAVCIPSRGRPVRPEWALAVATQNYPLNMSVLYLSLTGAEVGEARNALVEEALRKGCKYIFFIDDDTAPPHAAARLLMDILERKGPPYGDCMVVGGIYFSKTEPTTPVVFNEEGRGCFWGWEVGKAMEIPGPHPRIGTGCMMVNSEVFKHIEKPWFVTIDDPCDELADQGLEVSRNQVTDDVYFCRKVADAGYEIWLHGGVQCLHWTIEGQRYQIPEDSPPFLKWKKDMEEINQLALSLSNAPIAEEHALSVVR